MLAQDIKPFLPKLRSRELTNRAVARLLGVNETSISRILRQLKVVKDPIVKQEPSASKLYAARKAFRTEMANTLPIEEAARAANCSTRTIYRLREKK